MNNVEDMAMMEEIFTMIKFEEGRLSDDETIALFQRLLSTGLVWQLQGYYGRTAKALLAEGLISEEVNA